MYIFYWFYYAVFLQDIVIKIHGELNKVARTKSSDGEPDFRAMFEAMDEDGGGHLAIDEFLRGLKKMG